MAKIAALICMIIGTVMTPNVDGARVGDLKVTVKTGHNLQDRDGWRNKSDPYVELIAVDDSGKRDREITSTVQGNLNPTWNQQINFGYGTWKKILIRVYDADSNADDPLSDESVFLVFLGSYKNFTVQCYKNGYVTFDIEFR